MTKTLTVTPKISQKYTGLTNAAQKYALKNEIYLAEQKPKSKATRGLVGTVIDMFKAVAKKISKPEDAVKQIAPVPSAPTHKDPAALVINALHQG